jgi:hypothetical protein
VLLSTRDSDSVEIRSFRIVDGEVTEEDLRIVEGLGTDGRAAGRRSVRE